MHLSISSFRASLRRPIVLLALSSGVVAGLVVGGATVQLAPWSADQTGNAASAATSPTTVPETPGEAPLEEGAVVANEAAGELEVPIDLGSTRTLDGAVAAFSSYAAWLVGSPAAAEEPELASEVVGGKLINAADARLLAGMQRSEGDAFDLASGAYRVLGHAGDESRPDEVLVEVAGPLTIAGATRWAVIGGSIAWTDEGWQLVSIVPREVPQPSAADKSAESLSKTERISVLDGLGWHLFADRR